MAEQAPPFNYLQYQDPDAAIQLAQIQARMGLANALLSKGMEGSPGTSMAGNVAIRNSPLQGLANMLNTYSGGQALTKTLPREYQSAYTGMLNRAMGQPQPQSFMPSPGSQAMAAGAQQMPNQALPAGAPTPASVGGQVSAMAQPGQYNMGGTGPTQFNADAASQIPANQPNPLAPTDQDLARFSGIPAQRVAYMRVTGDPKYQDLAVEYQKLIPANVRLAAMSGQSPQAAAGATLRKETYVPPITLGRRELIDPFTHQPMGYLPELPEGMTPQYQPGTANVTGASMLPGVIPGRQALGEADAAAKAGYTLTQRYNPVTQQMEMVPVSTFTGRGPGAAGPGPAAAPGPARMAPGAGGNAAGPPLGTPEFASSTGTAAGTRANQLTSMAAGSPSRINVLDNIINLSNQGIKSGPSQGFMNMVGGYVTGNAAGAALFPGWKEQVTGGQELNKFLYQNALQTWQAAGGSGTDSQLEAQTHANPNDKMFPTALRNTSMWLKAGELGLQAKANAWDAWQQKNGPTPQSQQAFENQWRNSFRPNEYLSKVLPATDDKGWKLHYSPSQDKLFYVGQNGQYRGPW